MRLYYIPGTGRPVRVAWTLEELGVEYETVRLTREQAGGEEHRARQPLGRVPALELDGGQVLFESTAIVLTLADMHPAAGLIGAHGSRLRTDVYAWSILAMTELERSALGAWERTSHVEDAYRHRQRRLFADAAAAVGRQLADRPFLLGDALTAADIALGGVLGVAALTGVIDTAPENVAAYLRRLHSRPAFLRAAERTESLQFT